MTLNDGMSDIFYAEGDVAALNYKIKGRVKIVGITKPRRYNTGFEIVARRKLESQGRSLGEVAFVYKIKEVNSKNYMRIGPSAGPRINLNDNNWHDFSVELIGNQLIFKLDEDLQYYSVPDISPGGFSFRAENAEVVFDSLVAKRIVNLDYRSSKQIDTLQVQGDRAQVSSLETYKLSQLVAVKATLSNGKFDYVTQVEGIGPGKDILKWSLYSSANKYIELIGKEFVRFNKNVPDNTEIKLLATYLGKSVPLTLKVRRPSVDEVQYVKSGVSARAEDLLYRLREDYERRDVTKLDAEKSMSGTLPGVFAKILLNPRERNYDREIKWMVDYYKFDSNSDNKRISGAASFNKHQMMILYKELDGKISVSSEVWQRLIKLLKSTDYSRPDEWISENHKIVYYTTGYLASETWPNEIMQNGKRGRENVQVFKDYIISWINYRLKYGMGEYDSMNYMGVDMGALMSLFTYSKDPVVKWQAAKMLDFLYADILADSIDGVIGGASLRAQYENFYSGPNYTQIIYFNLGIVKIDENYPVDVQAAPHVVTNYMPSDVLFSFARDRSKKYTNKEKRALYVIPDKEHSFTLKKYSHVTPEYILGSVVKQDLRGHAGIGEINNNLQGFQEIPWSLTFGKSMNAKIFDSHPAEKDDSKPLFPYWRGGLYNKIYYRYHQENNVLLGMQTILDRKTQNFTHFWIPKEHLDKVIDGAGSNGWVFVKKDNVFAAIKMLKDGKDGNDTQYEWTLVEEWKNVEAKIKSFNTAFVLEVVDSSEFHGTFEEFIEEIKTNEARYPIKYQLLNDKNHFIEYRGRNGKVMRLDWRTGDRSVDGVVENYDSYHTLGARDDKNNIDYFYAPFSGPGMVKLRHGKSERNFSNRWQSGAPASSSAKSY